MAVETKEIKESDLDKLAAITVEATEINDVVDNLKDLTSSASQIDGSTIWVNSATAFGVVADGVTNDTIALQSAIDYAFDNKIGTVRLPSGKMLISEIILRSGVSLIGVRPKLTFIQNCPDLGFTMDSGSVFVPIDANSKGIVGNNIDSIGVDSGIKALSNIVLKDFGLKGFKYPIKIGAKNQLGMGMGGFDGIIIDGTNENNVQVTEIGMTLYNIQQTVNAGIYMFNVRNGVKIYNDKDLPVCSSGNSIFSKTYIFLDSNTRSEYTSSISSISLGTTTSITLSTAHNLETGDIIQINNATSTDASIINNIFSVYSVVDANTIILNINTTGKSINISTAILEKGRAGIHLISRGTQDLNHITFYSPQVNCFTSTSPNKGICNFAACGTSSVITGTTFNEMDIEGATDSHLFIERASSCTFNIAIDSITPPLGTINIKQSTNLSIISNDQDITLNIAHKSAQGGIGAINVLGRIAGYTTNSIKAKYGHYVDVNNAKTYFGGTNNLQSLVIDHSTPSIGVDNVTGTWFALRLFSKNPASKISGSFTIGIDRVGLHECINSSNITITLPFSGADYGQAKVGSPVLISKLSGIGNITITAASGQTLGGSSSSIILPANIGASIFLISTGEGDWVVVSQNNNGSLLSSGNTASRPTTTEIGFKYFDTSLNKPIWRASSGWVDSLGVSV